MGNDACVYISKKQYTRKTVEELLYMMDYKKFGDVFYCGNDEEYKYFSGVRVYKCDDTKEKMVYHIRTQIYCSGYDLKKQNDTIRCFKKYCNAWFISDLGKNRFFEAKRLIKGAESGCFFAIQNLDNNFAFLEGSLERFPEDYENEKKLMGLTGLPSPDVFNANVYLSYLCSLLEEYFRSTYIALLKYSDRKEKVLNTKFSPQDLADISEGKETVEEVFSRTLSFQNIEKVVSNFKTLDSKLDIGKPLKEPYKRRKETLYEQINSIFERRHRMIHRIEIDINYTSKKLKKDINDIKVALKRVYIYICNQYGWEVEEVYI